MCSRFEINTPVRGKIKLYNEHPVGGGCAPNIQSEQH